MAVIVNFLTSGVVHFCKLSLPSWGGEGREQRMTCEIISGTGVVFSVWGRPSPADMDGVVEAMRAGRESSGAPITYITRVPIDAPAPEPDVRRYLDSLMPLVVDNCSTYHVILEGHGFLAAMKRSVLVGVFQIRWRNGTFFVHADASEVASKVSPDRRAAVDALLARARQQGLLSRTPGLSQMSAAGGGIPAHRIP